ncbi:MAG: HlyC/CorC family transporter [Planctomycetes bacterium]|nr:HlyC/CorC family transporter [Planctomycetota bacterium]
MTAPLAILTTLVAVATGDEPVPIEDDHPPSIALWLALAAALSIVGTLGSIAASSLLLYSPAKLQRVIGGHSPDVLPQISLHRQSYHTIARMLSIVGFVSAGLVCWQATSGPQRAATLAVFAVVALVGGGVLPGRFAERRAEAVVLSSRGTLHSLRAMLHFPVVVPIAAIGDLLMRLFRIRQIEPNVTEIAGEILAAVEDKSTDSGLDEEEREWIENIVELKHTHASEVMTPRTDAIAFEQDLPLIDAVRQASAAGFSRFPVYRDTIDNVVGMFYAKDALPLIGENGKATDPKLVVGKFTREPLFVPETIDVVDLLRHFRTSRVQMAIVLDEYGGTAGLVSIEDVLEEIVGDISDEYDAEDASIKIVEAGKIYEAAGRCRVDEINEHLPVAIPEAEDYETIAGFVFTSLHRIPSVHESVEVGGLQFEVLEGDERRIHRLRLTVLQPQTSA